MSHKLLRGADREGWSETNASRMSIYEIGSSCFKNWEA